MFSMGLFLFLQCCLTGEGRRTYIQRPSRIHSQKGFHAGPVLPSSPGFSICLSVAERRVGAGDAADSLFGRGASRAGSIEVDAAFTAEEGGLGADLTGDRLHDAIAGAHGAVAAVAGAAVKGRVRADLTVDSLINDGALVMVSHMLLLIVFAVVLLCDYRL